MMATETGDAFERAADIEYRLQSRRQRKASSQGSLAFARMSLHESVNGFLFLAITLGVHYYFVQRVTNWVIAHAVLAVLTFLSIVSAWGNQRVAEAALLERRAASDD